MNVQFVSSFLRDVKKLRNRGVASEVEQAIHAAERAQALSEIPSLKRLSGHPGYYRIRIGDYRIGLKYDGATLVFVRCLHRREIYRFFP